MNELTFTETPLVRYIVTSLRVKKKMGFIIYFWKQWIFTAITELSQKINNRLNLSQQMFNAIPYGYCLTLDFCPFFDPCDHKSFSSKGLQGTQLKTPACPACPALTRLVRGQKLKLTEVYALGGHPERSRRNC